MGMTGNYFRADEFTIQRIKRGSICDIIYKEEWEDNILNIDKAWHAIHFTLTGCAYEGEEENILSQLVLGGTPVNGEDLGYGPARLLDRDTVRQMAEALEEWDEALFRKSFNMEEMRENDVYPMINGEDEGVFYTYVWENFAGLKEFFKKAAEEGQSIISFIA